MRGLYCVLFVAGCYRPAPAPGSPCASNGACPSGLTCVAEVCVRDGAEPVEPDAQLPADALADAAPPVLGAWANVTAVGGVNTAMVEDDPSCTADRLTIVFMSRRNGGSDLFIGTRATTAAPFTVAPLDTLNSAADDNSPEISADGKTLYFTSDRKVAGDNEVYIATRSGSGWTAPKVVTELSSGVNDDDVAVSPDGLTAIVARPDHLAIATRASTAVAFGPAAAVPSLAVAGTNVAAPSITNGGAAVYFHAGDVRDLYVAIRSGTSYLPARPVTELNTAMRDAAPFVLDGERYILFARGDDLYEATR